MPYSGTSGYKGSLTTWDSINHIGLCHSHKIRYVILWHVLSKSLDIYTYGDTGIMELDSVTGSRYLGDPRVDQHHLIIRNTHSIIPSSWSQALLLCFQRSMKFVWNLTHYCQAIIDAPNSCGSSWLGIPPCHLTLILRTLS